jgi:hypothetical protein
MPTHSTLVGLVRSDEHAARALLGRVAPHAELTVFRAEIDFRVRAEDVASWPLRVAAQGSRSHALRSVRRIGG